MKSAARICGTALNATLKGVVWNASVAVMEVILAGVGASKKRGHERRGSACEDLLLDENETSSETERNVA